MAKRTREHREPESTVLQIHDLYVQEQQALLDWKRWFVVAALILLTILTVMTVGVVFLVGFGQMKLPDNVLLALAATIPVEMVGIISTIVAALWKDGEHDRKSS